MKYSNRSIICKNSIGKTLPKMDSNMKQLRFAFGKLEVSKAEGKKLVGWMCQAIKPQDCQTHN